MLNTHTSFYDVIFCSLSVLCYDWVVVLCVVLLILLRSRRPRSPLLGMLSVTVCVVLVASTAVFTWRGVIAVTAAVAAAFMTHGIDF